MAKRGNYGFEKRQKELKKKKKREKKLERKQLKKEEGAPAVSEERGEEQTEASDKLDEPGRDTTKGDQ